MAGAALRAREPEEPSSLTARRLGVPRGEDPGPQLHGTLPGGGRLDVCRVLQTDPLCRAGTRTEGRPPPPATPATGSRHTHRPAARSFSVRLKISWKLPFLAPCKRPESSSLLRPAGALDTQLREAVVCS